MASTDLVLLHGAVGSSAQFASWVPLLETQFKVHTLDFEGHGARAFGARPFHIDHFAENLSDYLRANGLEGANVFGYSMGGYVAMRLARLQPGSIGKLFTFATKLNWTVEGAAKEAKMLDAEVIELKVPKFAAALAERHHGNDWKEHLRRTAEMMHGLGAKPLLGPEDFAALDFPVRMGLGDRDNMVSLEETAGAYRMLPQGELIVLPGMGHSIEKLGVERMCGEVWGYFR